MVKNNASTSYDVTDKSITPLVRVGRQFGCGAGLWGAALSQELRLQGGPPGGPNPCCFCILRATTADSSSSSCCHRVQSAAALTVALESGCLGSNSSCSG